MAVTYDGSLVLRRTGSRAVIEPCCSVLHRCVMDGQVYPSSGRILLRHRRDDRGEQLYYCPFCGARAVVA